MSSPVSFVPLTEVAEINPSLPVLPAEAEEVAFVPMSAVNEASTDVTEDETRPFAEVRRGYTPFMRDDVLVAKITPCFENGKIALASLRRSIGFGSTEFHVVRARQDVLAPRYLAHFLRQERIRTEGQRRMTGSGGQRRVPAHFVSSLTIPLPPLSEQQRIAAILDQADALRAKRRAAIAKLDALAQSIFLDMFGDPATNPRAFPVSTIAGIADQVTDGEHLTPVRTTEGIKLLSARNVRDGFIDWSNVDYIGLEEYERISRRCKPATGDILISCSGTIGRVAAVETDEPFSLVRSAALVRPRIALVRTKFLEHYLRTPALRAKMLRSANASSQANLFQGQIRELPVLVPPVELQDSFSAAVSRIASLRVYGSRWASELDVLFAGLQHRVFCGDN